MKNKLDAPDQQRMLDAAAGSFLAGERCEVPLAFGNYAEHTLGPQAVMLYSLSVEIALKALAELTSAKRLRDNEGHNLAALYNNLSGETRRKLEANYPGGLGTKGIIGLLSAEVDVDEWIRDCRELGIPEPTPEQIAAEQVVAKDSNLAPFVTWRYLYEFAELEMSDDNLRRIFIACYRTIRELAPHLVSHYEREWGKFEPDPEWVCYEKQKFGLESSTSQPSDLIGLARGVKSRNYRERGETE